MQDARIKTEYLCYLMNRAQVNAEGEHGYLRLCSLLQSTAFTPKIAMDENRSDDCRCLRQDFADYCNDPELADILDEIYENSGTMMELFVVLSEYMRYQMLCSAYEAGTGKWFHELLINCGLDVMENDVLENHEDAMKDVHDILKSINDRKTGWDGCNGGLFPLMYPQYDQRYVEIIIQANNYLEENYELC
ncbi:MAG: hypothetical protein II545_06720 [Lachnospiraceae bacterium]|nr:hypothetical protein [Lachnospiraceae bacterium]